MFHRERPEKEFAYVIANLIDSVLLLNFRTIDRSIKNMSWELQCSLHLQVACSQERFELQLP